MPDTKVSIVVSITGNAVVSNQCLTIHTAQIKELGSACLHTDVNTLILYVLLREVVAILATSRISDCVYTTDGDAVYLSCIHSGIVTDDFHSDFKKTILEYDFRSVDELDVIAVCSTKRFGVGDLKQSTFTIKD